MTMGRDWQCLKVGCGRKLRAFESLTKAPVCECLSVMAPLIPRLDETDAVARILKASQADIEAGRVHDHEDVVRELG